MRTERADNPVNWRIQPQRYRLMGEICACGEKIFPPKDICPNCHAETQTPYCFSGKGQIYSFTKVFETSPDYQDNLPYFVALIKLEEGGLIASQLTDLGNEEPQIGMPVEMTTRILKRDGESGMIVYGYKFRPILKASTT